MITETKVNELKNALRVGMMVTAHGLPQSEVIGLYPHIVLLKTSKRNTTRTYNELLVDNVKIIESI